MVISRDVIFDEMAEWKWEDDASQKAPMFETFEDQKEAEDAIPKPRSSLESSRSLSSSPSNSPRSTKKVRSLSDIYRSSEEIALFSCEPQNFEEAAKRRSLD